MVPIERGLIKADFGYIHYRTAGSGTPIVLMHINQQSSALYLELIAALAPTMRVIAIDYPSHGSSDHLPQQPTIADYARYVVHSMEALGIKRFYALGEATGTAVAIELAGSYPDRLNGIVLVNCPIIDEPPEVMLAPFKSTFRPADSTGFPTLRTIEFMLETDPEHSPVAPDQNWMDRMNRAQVECGRDRWQCLTALAHYDLAGSQKKVNCPALLLVGDQFYARPRVQEIQDRIRGVEMHILPNTRFCAGWERASEIASKVNGFVGKLGG